MPADGVTLDALPGQMTMTFKRTIRLTRVSAAPSGQDPVKLDLGEQTKFETDFILPLDVVLAERAGDAEAGSDVGNYVIEWRGLGKDGHALNGSFSFVVE